MIEVVNAESQLIKLLNANGVNMVKPDIQKAWSVFKQFAKEPVACNNDGVLFQIGCYSDRCFFDLVRQFVINDEEDDEYSHMEQLHLEFTCELKEELIGMEKNLWSYQFNCLDDYFEAVESLTEFQEAIGYDFWQSEVYQEVV